MVERASPFEEILQAVLCSRIGISLLKGSTVYSTSTSTGKKARAFKLCVVLNRVSHGLLLWIMCQTRFSHFKSLTCVFLSLLCEKQKLL